MRATSLMRCSHCGVPLRIEATSGLMTITCTKCGKPSLAIVVSGGMSGSVRLDPDIMIASSAVRQTEHVRDQLAWFMKNHPEIVGLEDVVSVLTKKLAEEMKFSSQAEKNRLEARGPIKDSEVKGFHRALLLDGLTFEGLVLL